MRLRCLISVLGLVVLVGAARSQQPETDPKTDLHAPRVLTEEGESPLAFLFGSYERPKIVTFDAEFLFWYFRDEQLPLDLSIQANSLTDVNTTPLTTRFGKRGLAGGRLSLGWWDTDRDPLLEPFGAHLRSFGYEISGLFFGARDENFRSAAAPVIFRPFFDFNNHRLSAVFVAAPGLASGEITGSGQFQLWGIEANVWQNLCQTAPGTVARFGIMAGLRNLNFESDLDIRRETLFNQNLAAFPIFLPFAGNRLEDVDSISTRNHFFGAQFGASLKTYIIAAEVSATAKLGLGWNHEMVEYEGQQVRTRSNGVRTTAPGALFALPSNIGSHHRNRFAVIPELNLNVSVPIGSRVAVNGGYTLLYWNRIIRASEQIDRVIDITQIPSFPVGTATPTGLRHPGVLFRERNLFLTGLNFGVTITW